jgi:hypothetical protein
MDESRSHFRIRELAFKRTSCERNEPTGNVAERVQTEEDGMVLFLSGALLGLILGLTVCAYAAGIFGTGLDRYKEGR